MAVAVLVFLVVIDRNRWFNNDEWEAIALRTLFGTGRASPLFPYTVHFALVPTVVYRVLFNLFGVRHHLPYLFVVVLAHLLAVWLLWRLLLRLGVSAWVAVATATAVALLGVGWEDVFDPFQIAFVLPVAVAFAALLILPVEGRFSRRDAVVAALLVFAVMCSNVGLISVLVAALVQLARRGVRTAVLTVLPGTVIWLAWFAEYHSRVSTSGALPLRTAVQQLPAWVWTGLTQPISNAAGLDGVGAVAIVLLVVWAVRRTRLSDPWLGPLALAVGSVAFLAMTGIGRLQFGVSNATTPRYAYVALVLLAPLAAMAVDATLRRTALRPVVLVMVTAVLVLVGASQLKNEADKQTTVEREYEGRVLATAQLARMTTTFLANFPLGEQVLTVAQVHQLDEYGDLPRRPVSRSATMTALSYLQVVVDPEARVAKSAPVFVLGHPGAGEPVALGAGCVSITAASSHPRVFLSDTGAAVLRVTPGYDGPLTVVVFQGDAASPPRPFLLTGGRMTKVGLNLPAGVEVSLEIPPSGATEVCGVQNASPASPSSARLGSAVR
jgi:hypothetical protein